MLRASAGDWSTSKLTAEQQKTLGNEDPLAFYMSKHDFIQQFAGAEVLLGHMHASWWSSLSYLRDKHGDLSKPHKAIFAFESKGDGIIELRIARSGSQTAAIGFDVYFAASDGQPELVCSVGKTASQNAAAWQTVQPGKYYVVLGAELEPTDSECNIHLNVASDAVLSAIIVPPGK